MTYDNLAKVFKKRGVFTIGDVPKVAGRIGIPNRANLPRALHWWAKAGKIIPLRRGVYILPVGVRDQLTAQRIANVLYGPSYVSGLWQLSRYGHIAEGAVEVTNATTQNPAYFETPNGRYRYQHLTPRLFFGYTRRLGPRGIPIVVADREKALLDFLWWRLNDKLRPGFVWNEDEFKRWRIADPFGQVNERKLMNYAERFNDTRLFDAAKQLADHLRRTRLEIIRPTEGRIALGLAQKP